MRGKVVLLLIFTLSTTSCYRSKDGPPRRFINKGDTLIIYIVDKQHLEEVVKTAQGMFLKIERAKREGNYYVVIVEHGFGLGEYELSGWTWVEDDEELIRAIVDRNGLMAAELTSKYKKNIFFYGMFEGELQPSLNQKFPSVKITAEFIGELDDVLDVVNRYYKVLEVY